VDSGTDALIGATAADIGDRVINIGVGRFWPILEQRHDGHDHSALAVTALRDIVIDPRLLDGVKRAVLGKSLDGCDLAPAVIEAIGIVHERTGASSICTVQAPHWAMPQP